MKFPPFDYFRATSLKEAVAALEANEEAKALAGGQSLLVLMAMRLAAPSLLVDISRLQLAGVELQGSGCESRMSVGALSTHAMVASDPAVRRAAPMLAQAAAAVGHPAIRNLGTLGGSLAHADPAAELPAATLALDAQLVLCGPEGERRVPARDCFVGHFSTCLEPAELIVAIELPLASGCVGGSWCEWAQRPGDFAEVGVGVQLELGDGGRVGRARGAVCGVGGVPVGISEELGQVLVGERADDRAVLAAVGQSVKQVLAPAGEDKSVLGSLLAARSVNKAYQGALVRSRAADEGGESD